MFDTRTCTIFSHAMIGLNKLLFAFNTSICQVDPESDVSYRSLRRHVKQFARTINASTINLVDPVEDDEVYATEGLKGRDRGPLSRFRGLSKRGRGSYAETSHRCPHSLRR